MFSNTMVQDERPLYLSASLLMRLLVLLSVVQIASLGRTHSDVCTDDDFNAETAVADRQARGGKKINGATAPGWWMPMYGADYCSDPDGYLCGNGIRFKGNPAYFLGSIPAMNRLNETLENHPWRMHGWFDFYKDTTIENDMKAYAGVAHKPVFRKEYKFGKEARIGLYSMEIRGGIYNWFADNAWRDYQFMKSVNMETSPLKNASSCFTYSYSADDSDTSQRDLVAMDLEVDRCKPDGVCNLYAAGFGSLCGIYSNLGAPVLCGPDRRLTFIIVSMDWENNIMKPNLKRTHCSPRYQAVRVAFIAKDIAWDLSETHIEIKYAPYRLRGYWGFGIV